MGNPIQLRDLEPMQVAKTHSTDEGKKLTYILLKKDEDSFTVFTSEKNGFVMTCKSKKLLVDVCFSPKEENIELYSYKYQNKEYEFYRKKAIEHLRNHQLTEPKERILAFEGNANNWFKNSQRKAASSMKQITKYEEQMQNATPEKKERFTTYIERGPIAKEVKKLSGFKCMICEGMGSKTNSFCKANGVTYVETHHIEHVAKLKTGSLSMSNLITVCANHHRQFHYGKLRIKKQDEKYFYVELDDKSFKVEKIKIP